MSKLSELVKFSEALNRDSLPYNQKQQRDRQIGIAADTSKPNALVRAWLAHFNDEDINDIGKRSHFIWLTIQLAFLTLGLLAGASIAKITLFYDGSTPINIIIAWLVLAGLPFALACLWALTLLPIGLPIISTLSKVVQQAIFQPLISWLSQRLNTQSSHAPQTFKPSASLLVSMANVAMQWFGLGIGLGVLLTTFLLLASSDLAFAWSTSLSLSEKSLHQITSVISTPFFNLMDSSTPSLKLIQDSHYFRLGASAANQIAQPDLAKTLTQWWPFLIASIAFYSVVSRLITISIARYRFNKQIESEWRTHPEYAALIARMNAPLVITQATKTSSTEHQNTPTPKQNKTVFELSAPLITWGKIDLAPSALNTALECKGLTGETTHQAGGVKSTEDDAKLVLKIKQAGSQHAIILVKAWEPPLLEFRDWIANLRHAIDGSLIVLLVDPDNKIVSELDLQIWRDDLSQLNDPALYVEPIGL